MIGGQVWNHKISCSKQDDDEATEKYLKPNVSDGFTVITSSLRGSKITQLYKLFKDMARHYSITPIYLGSPQHPRTSQKCIYKFTIGGKSSSGFSRTEKKSLSPAHFHTSTWLNNRFVQVLPSNKLSLSLRIKDNYYKGCYFSCQRCEAQLWGGVAGTSNDKMSTCSRLKQWNTLPSSPESFVQNFISTSHAKITC